ncbi:hypothetical protein [Acidovorax sp. 22279]|uniref:hypothetical protein n=1 Tax=Acidovorax sp. 22279 TaxID=3453900 RepID=UPI003F8409EA
METQRDHLYVATVAFEFPFESLERLRNALQLAEFCCDTDDAMGNVTVEPGA